MHGDMPVDDLLRGLDVVAPYGVGLVLDRDAASSALRRTRVEMILTADRDAVSGALPVECRERLCGMQGGDQYVVIRAPRPLLPRPAMRLPGAWREASQAMTRSREIDPTLRISDLRDRHPIRRPGDLAVFSDGLRKAGLPDT
jgi:hypothetical protein